MRRFGLSAAVVVALAAPAWAQYPTGYAPAGLPMPAGYPLFDPVSAQEGSQPSGWYAPPGPPVAPAPAAPGEGPCQPDPCGFAFDPCSPPYRGRGGFVQAESWVRLDWLYWNFRNTPVPLLLTTGDPTLPFAGIPGGGNATPLLGSSRDVGRFNGIRTTFGRWFDPDGELGGEASAFVFGREGTASVFGGPGQPVSVPVIGTNGVVGAYDVSFPGRAVGTATFRTATNLIGAEAILLHRLYGNGCINVDSLFGYRFMQLNERIDLLTQIQPTGIGTALPAGGTVFTSDSFRARTEFHGAVLGGRVEARRDIFTVTLYGKGGAGATIQTLRAEGSTTVTTLGGATSTVVGGIRVQPTNFGRDQNTDFSLFGETGIELGVQVTKHVSLRGGYNLLWWSDVLRPGSVISPVATLSQVPIDPTFNRSIPATRPVTVFRSSDFLAHGLVVGVLIDW